ncbi:hypothetical protein INR49_019598 [Caranx melampygus]|nr:hypothetical protein INR49_019598 [Caranx melampygus]
MSFLTGVQGDGAREGMVLRPEYSVSFLMFHEFEKPFFNATEETRQEFSYPGRITLSRGRFLPHAPHGSTMHYVRISLWIAIHLLYTDRSQAMITPSDGSMVVAPRGKTSLDVA